MPGVFALALGRVANFINQEIVGTVTDVSWCGPFKPQDCKAPKSEFCDIGADSTCCLPEQECVKESGYSWCKTKEVDCKAKGPGDTSCGKLCCAPEQFCGGNGRLPPESCKMLDNKNCPAGKEKCIGTSNDYAYVICCNIGTCLPALKGIPRCSDNVYWP